MINKHQNGIGFHPQEKHEVKDFFGVWRRLLRSCRPHLVALIFSVICAIGTTALTILAPLKMAELTNLISSTLYTGVEIDAFTAIAVTLVLMYVSSALLSALLRWLTAGMAQHVSHHIRYHVFQKINRLPLYRCEHLGRGDLLSRVTNDVDMVGHALHESIGELLPAAALLVGSLLMMLLTDVMMASVAVAATLIGVGGMLLIMRYSQKYFVRQQRHLGELNSHVEECYTGVATVRDCSAEQSVKQTFLRLNAQLAKSSFSARFFSGLLTPLMSFMGNLGYLAVCVTGAVLVLNGRITFGVIVAFMFFVHHFAHPFAEIATAMQGVQSAAAAGERVYEFLDMEEAERSTDAPVHLETVRGALTLEGVSFCYPDEVQDVLHGLSFDIAPGEHVAICGATGSGKTTLAYLLAGFYRPHRGHVYIDGVDVAQLGTEQLHRCVSLVLRNAWIFEGTVRENLSYCTEAHDEQKMLDVCRAIGADAFIEKLPLGYDTVLGRGITLSEGERQMISLVRALIADRPIMILDEAAVTLDAIREARIARAVRELTAGRTTLTISHRMSTLQAADRVLVMENGTVADVGTHKELLERNGAYAALLS